MAQIKSIEKDSEHGMTVTGALPPCGKIKAKYLCDRIKEPNIQAVIEKPVFPGALFWQIFLFLIIINQTNIINILTIETKQISLMYKILRHHHAACWYC